MGVLVSNPVIIVLFLLFGAYTGKACEEVFTHRSHYSPCCRCPCLEYWYIVPLSPIMNEAVEVPVVDAPVVEVCNSVRKVLQDMIEVQGATNRVENSCHI